MFYSIHFKILDLEYLRQIFCLEQQETLSGMEVNKPSCSHWHLQAILSC